MSDLAQALIIYGPLGIACIALGYACGHLYRELVRSQQARVDDAKKLAETLLKISEENNRVINELTNAVDSLSRAFESLSVNGTPTGKTDSRTVFEQRPVRPDPRIDVVDTHPHRRGGRNG